MMRLKAIILGLSVAAAFIAGFTVATWRAAAQRVNEIERREVVFRGLVEQMNAEVAAANVRTQTREAALAAELASAQQQTEDLRREIAERPVVRQVVRTQVAGECAPVPTVDWSVFAQLYNRAATGAAAPGAADDRDDVVSEGAAGNSF